MTKLIAICSFFFGINGTTQETQLTETIALYENNVALETTTNLLTEEKFTINDITYIKDEVEITFDFDVKQYLPRGFNPYEVYFDINSVEFIEDEEEPVFNFDLNKYLPKDFKTKPQSI